MFDQIIGFSIRNKFIVLLFVLALIGWGGYSLTQLPIDAVPDITSNQVIVITQSPNLAAEEVEKFITAPLEISMSHLPNIKELRSISRFGLSVITVVFQDGFDIFTARQLVGEQIVKVSNEIPPGFGQPEMAPISTGLSEAYQYYLEVKPGYEGKYTLADLRTIQDWTIKRQLAGIPGVIEVSSYGGWVKQYEVAIHPERLRSYNLSLADIFKALQKNNENTGGSYIEKEHTALYIRGLGMTESLEEIGKIVVDIRQGIPILVKDVANVQFGKAIRYGALTANGNGEVAGGVVLLLKGANAYTTVEKVKEKVKEIQKSLPQGIQISSFIDRTKLIDRAIHTVSKNLIEGGVIVVMVLLVLLGNYRAGLIVASVIPLAMLFAVGMMHLTGVSANLMSLGAIDFGLIVDGAVIIVEAILHHTHWRYKGLTLNQKQMDESVFEASSQIRHSASFGEIIILMVYVPILALAGIEGKMFRPMAQTVIFAIIGALILSLTYVPMASAYFLQKKIHTEPHFSDKMIDKITVWYQKALKLAIQWPKVWVTVTVCLFLFSIWKFTGLGGEFVPDLEEGDFAIEARIAPGSSLKQMVQTCSEAERILLQFPEVKKVATRIGSSEIPVDPMPVETGDIIVVLKPKNEWQHVDKQEDLIEKMENALDDVAGLSVDFQQPIQMRFNELISGVKSDVAVKIHGDQLDVLFQKANEVAATIKGIPGVEDIKVEQTQGMPQLMARYKREKLAQYGLNVTDLNTALRTAFAGERAGVVFEGEKRFDLVVRFDDPFRKQISDVQRMYIDLPSGQKVPLEEVAEITLQEAPGQVSREFAKRRIYISFNVRGRDVESTVHTVQDALAQQVQLPSGYYYSYGGQFENLIEAKARLSLAVPIALAVIFVLLYFTFHSITQSLLIFTAIPLSAIGGIWSLWLRDMPFSISAGIGFIALFGVAVLNGIVLIGYFNQLEKEGIKDIMERILKGTSVRLRPVLLTALVASLGFLPMAISVEAGAEVQRPLATVVIGGLLTATVLTLFILPLLYLLAHTQKINPKAGLGLLALGILCILPHVSSKAQTQNQPMDEKALVNFALENNPWISASSFEIEQFKALKKSTLDIGKTQVGFQYGQTQDPIGRDYTGSIVQRIPFPSSMVTLAKVFGSLTEEANLILFIKKVQLSREIKLSYNEWLYTSQLQLLAQRQDSMYNQFAKAAEKRYATGDASNLEKLASISKAQEIKNLLQQKEKDLNIIKAQLSRWTTLPPSLQVKTMDLEERQSKAFALASEADLGQNPQMMLSKQVTKTRLYQVKHEKNLLGPDFTVGYFNQSIARVPGNQFAEGGIAFPIFLKPYLARIKAAEMAEKVAQSLLEYQTNLAKADLELQLQQSQKWKQSLVYYQTYAIPQAEEILRSTKRSYFQGELGYVEYVTLASQAFSVFENYYNTLRQLNISIIELESLLGIYQYE